MKYNPKTSSFYTFLRRQQCVKSSVTSLSAPVVFAMFSYIKKSMKSVPFMLFSSAWLLTPNLQNCLNGGKMKSQSYLDYFFSAGVVWLFPFAASALPLAGFV